MFFSIEKFHSIFTHISEYIFPIFCLGCDREGIWLCDECFQFAEHPGVFFCPVCHADRPLGQACSSCLPLSYVSRHVAMFPYQDDALIGDVIRHIKYHYIEELLGLLSCAVEKTVERQQGHFQGVEAIIPIPLHKKRYAERGFNQAELIAQMVSRATDIPVSTSLVRVRATPHQARLGKEERMVNVKDAFHAPQLPYKRVLLVDDVYTTGTTMQEAAKTLRFSGLEEVRGFSLARGVRGH